MRESQVWRETLGFHDGWASVLVVLLFAYNVGRVYLTTRVMALREQEERSGDSPRLEEYTRDMCIDPWVRILGVLAFGIFVVNAGAWATLRVLMPIG